MSIHFPGKSLPALLLALLLSSCGGSDPGSGSDRPRQLSQVVSVAESVALSGPTTEYIIVRNADTVRIVHRSGAEAPLQVSHTTVAHFTDVSLSFDLSGTPGQSFRLYQAAFARIPDVEGLGFWAQAAKNGYSMDIVAAEFEKSAEYARLYGGAPKNEDVVNRYYSNVLGRVPDAGGAAYWLNALDSGVATRVQVLRAFAESDENKARTLPFTANGIPARFPGQAYPQAYDGQAPVAYLGASRRAAAGSTVTLAGGQSVSRTGNPLVFEWSFISKPSTSASAIAQNAAAATFTPDVPGVYTVGLTVTDGLRRSAGAAMDVTVGDGNPIEDALSVTVLAGGRVSGATVVLRDAHGRTTSAATNAQGEARLNVAGLSPPYLVRSSVSAQEGSAMAGLTLYGYYLSGEQRANLTPVTTAVLAAITGNRNAAAFDLFLNEVSAKALLAEDRVRNAEQAVLEIGEKLGVPRSLLASPNAAPALVPVALPPAMAGTNLFGVLAEGVKAVVDNAIRHGCDGTAYGTMEDGSRRPSCLEGENRPLTQGAKLQSKTVARAADPTIRADELVGVHAPGGGWKFRGQRVPAEERAARLGETIFSMIKEMDTYAVLNDRETDASAITFLKSVNWTSFCQRLTDEVRVSALSDVFHGYRLIKLVLENKSSTPLASWRISGLPLDAVDRVVPSSGPDEGDPTIGKLKQVCIASASQLTSEMRSGSAAPPPYDLSNETVGSMATRYVAAFLAYMAIDWTHPEFDARSQAVMDAGMKAMICKVDAFTLEDYMLLVGAYAGASSPATQMALERVRSRANSLDKCDPFGAQNGVATARQLGVSIAERLITAYETEFSIHFRESLPPSVTAYAVRATPGHRLSMVEYDIVLPDMAATGVTVEGNKVRQLPATWKYVERPTPTQEVVVNAELRAAYLGCFSNDKACLAMLARTRKHKALTPLVAATSDLRRFDLNDLLVMQANLVQVEEALNVLQFPFLEPGQ